VLAKVLKDIADQRVQLLPLSIQGNSKLKYFAVNVLDSVELMDRDRSKFSVFEGTNAISQIKSLVLRKAKNLPPIFHLAENPPLIIIDDELKKALEKASDSPGYFKSVVIQGD
jgi:hypothetical protein